MELDRSPTVQPSGYTEVDAALGEVVEEGHVLGDAEGVPVGEDDAALADAEGIGMSREVLPEHEGVGRSAEPSIPGKVVLGDPDGGETALFEESGLLAHFVDHRVPRIRRAEVIVGRAIESHAASTTTQGTRV